MTTNPKEPATDAVNRTAQEILAALQAKDSAKVNSYYAPDAVIATPGRPAAKDGRAVSKAIRDDIADPNFTMSLSNEKTEVAGSGDLAYRRGTLKITYRVSGSNSTKTYGNENPTRLRVGYVVVNIGEAVKTSPLLSGMCFLQTSRCLSRCPGCFGTVIQ